MTSLRMIPIIASNLTIESTCKYRLQAWRRATGGDVIQPDCSCSGVSTDLQSVCVAIAAGADDAEEDASGDY